METRRNAIPGKLPKLCKVDDLLGKKISVLFLEELITYQIRLQRLIFLKRIVNVIQLELLRELEFIGAFRVRTFVIFMFAFPEFHLHNQYNS